MDAMDDLDVAADVATGSPARRSRNEGQPRVAAAGVAGSPIGGQVVARGRICAATRGLLIPLLLASTAASAPARDTERDTGQASGIACGASGTPHRAAR